MQLRTTFSLVRYAKLLRPRFSLRTLLAGFTLFAIGFPVWFQWPWTTTKWKYRECPCTGKIVPGEPPIGWITYTWRRQGLRWHLDGPWREYDRNGALCLEEFYWHGERHGPYRRISNYEVVEGNFVHDQRDGVWTYRSNGGSVEWRKEFRHNQVQEFALVVNEKMMRRLTIHEERLIATDGIPAQSLITTMPVSGDLAIERLNWELTRPTTYEFVETPLSEAFEFLGNQHSVQFMIGATVDHDLPITEYCLGLRFHEGLAILCQPRGLVCDFRSGAIWITTPEEKEAWNRSRRAFAELVAVAE